MNDDPKWAKRILGAEGRKRIEAAIAAAERKTSGEIVPVLVRRSSTTGHVPLLSFCLLMLLVLAFELPHLQASWCGSYAVWFLVDWFVAAAVAIGIARLDTVQRLLTPRFDQICQVDLRAQVEFYELGLDKTAGRTGVLLLVSLMERRAVVLGDKAIAERLDQAIWQEVVDLMIAGVKRRDLAGGWCKAIERCGDLLGAKFPIEAKDVNELRNRLNIKA